MAAQNFKVKNGLTVGNYSIIDAQGNVSVPGNLVITGTISVPGGFGNIITSGVKVGSYQVIDSSKNINASSLSISSNQIIDSNGDITAPGDITVTGTLSTSLGDEYSTKQYVDDEVAIAAASGVTTGKAIAMAIVFG